MDKFNKSRAFIDMNGGYQSIRSGLDKEAHDAWVKSNSWNLSRDDFIRLSYFHGSIENGSDGLRPINGTGDYPHDVVYVSEIGRILTRNQISYWLDGYSTFTLGYKIAKESMIHKPLTENQMEECIASSRAQFKRLYPDAIGVSNTNELLIRAVEAAHNIGN